MDETDKFDGWQRITNLGNGGFGTVDLWRKGDEEIALKQIRASGDISKKMMERWKKEIEIMKRLKHLNVITAKEIPPPLEILSQSLPILAMEYCSKGDLRKVISKTCKGLKETEILKFSKDVSSAVEYLHSQRIVHRDLKPENIVLKEVDGKILYKLIDLGYAKDLDQGSICNSFVGTLQYLAPELYKTQVYTHTVDYWSLGTVIFEIITGFRPFLPNKPPVQWFDIIKEKKDGHISVYEENNTYIYQKTLPVHIRLCEPLKQAFQQWLKTMLIWDKTLRGNDHEEKGKKQTCFTELETILEMKILSFYHVMENTMLHYPLAQDQTFEDVQSLISLGTNIPIEEQEIFLIDGKEPKRCEMAKEILNQCIHGEVYPLFLFQKHNIPEKQSRVNYFRPLPPKVRYLNSNESHMYSPRAIWEEAVYYCEQILSDCDNLMNCHKATWSAEMIAQQKFSDAYETLNCLIQSLTAKVDFFLISLRHNVKKYHDQAQGGISSNSVINSWLDKEKEAINIQQDVQKCKTLIEAKNFDTKKTSSILTSKNYDYLKQKHDYLKQNVAAAKDLYIRKVYPEPEQENTKLFFNCIQNQKDIFNEIHDKLIEYRHARLKFLADLDEVIQYIASLQKYSNSLTTSQKQLQGNIWKLIEVALTKSTLNSKTSPTTENQQFLSTNSMESLQVLQDNHNMKKDLQESINHVQSIIDSL